MPPMKNSNEDHCADWIGNCVDYSCNLDTRVQVKLHSNSKATAPYRCGPQPVIVVASWLRRPHRIQVRKPLRPSIAAPHNIVQRKADQNPNHSQQLCFVI